MMSEIVQKNDVGNYEEDAERPLAEGKDHPLLNDTILKILFEFMRPKDLKSCRLVCTKWSVATLPAIRLNFEITLNRENLRNFVELMESNTLGIPFSKFKLEPFFTEDGDGQKFIQLCGNGMQSLDLFLHANPEPFTVKDVSYLLQSAQNLETFRLPRFLYTKRDAFPVKLFPGSAVPNLTRLKKIEVATDRPILRKRVCPTLFEELFGSAENVSTIHTLDGISDMTLESLEVLDVLKKLGRESQIETLSFSHVEGPHLIILREMASNGLKLKELKIIHGSLNGECAWPELIDLFKDTLVSFFYSDLEFAYHMIIFSEMPLLKKLYLCISSSGTMCFDHFNSKFPSLESMCLNSLGCDPKQTQLTRSGFCVNAQSCPNMTALSLGYYVINFQVVEHIANIFPNLKVLELNISTDGSIILNLIWTKMTRLEKLKITGTFSSNLSLDSAFTGISDKNMSEIHECIGSGLLTNIPAGVRRGGRILEVSEVRRARILELSEELRTYSYIGNLTNLRSLQLELTVSRVGRSVYPDCFTDVAGYFGFYSQKNLEYLSIRGCQISRICSEILIADLALDTWEFQNVVKNVTLSGGKYSNFRNFH